MTKRGNSSTSYDQEAGFYDYSWDRFTADLAFYRKRLRRAQTVLDAMCGTGRVSVDLARGGHDVWGVDRSAAMLARARKRLAAEPRSVQRRVRWRQSDLVRGAAGKNLDAAVIAVNSYGLVLRAKDRVTALRQIRDSLRVGGTLLLALDSVRSYRTIRDGVPFLSIARPVEGGRRIYVGVSAETGSTADRARTESLHILLARSGRVLTTAEGRTVTAVLSPAQVKRELRQAGFSPRHAFGDYDQRAYSPSGARFIIEAEAV